MRTLFLILALALMTHLAVNAQTTPYSSMMVRIAEIEIDSTYLDEYMAILQEESSMSVKLETGVISIFPMFQKDHPTTFRLLEIYASKEAYQSHLKTPHFLHYKKATLHMVKSLKLVEMSTLDPKSMPLIFSKMK